jgi:muramidase (phage lysozyme)
VEIDEAVGKIGKQVIDRIQLPEGVTDDGTYDRPDGLGFSNPYTDGTAPAPQQPQQAQPAPAPQQKTEAAPTAPTPGENAAALGKEAGSLVPDPEVTDFLNGLQPAQRQSVEASAVRMGMSVPDFTRKVLLAPKASAQKMAYEPSDRPTMTPEIASQFIEQAMSPGDVGGAANAPTSLLSLIRKHEAAGNYNAVYGNAHSKVDLGQYSLNQVLAMQVAARARGVPSTAVGGYQIIYHTLRRLKADLGLSGAEKFTPELQDRLALALLEGRGLREFQAGKLSKRRFALGLSQV